MSFVKIGEVNPILTGRRNQYHVSYTFLSHVDKVRYRISSRKYIQCDFRENQLSEFISVCPISVGGEIRCKRFVPNAVLHGRLFLTQKPVP